MNVEIELNKVLNNKTEIEFNCFIQMTNCWTLSPVLFKRAIAYMQWKQ